MRGKNKTPSVSLTFTTTFTFVLYADSQIFKLSQSNFSDFIYIYIYIYIYPPNSHCQTLTFWQTINTSFAVHLDPSSLSLYQQNLYFWFKDFFSTVHWTFLLLLPNFDHSLVSTPVFILIHLILLISTQRHNL